MTVEHRPVIKVDAELETAAFIIVAHGAVPLLRLFLTDARKAQDFRERTGFVDRLRSFHKGGQLRVPLPGFRGEALKSAL
jgi:hypothetical protein